MNPSTIIPIIVVSWNSEADLFDTFTALTQLDYPNTALILVDNGSDDGSVGLVRRQFPQVEIIETGKNLYFTGGYNTGLRYALAKYHPEFVGIVNPDAMVSSNWLSSQLAVMQQDPKIGIVGPKVLFAKGFGMRDGAQSDSSAQIINTVGLTQGGFLFPYDLGVGQLDHGQYDKQVDVFGVSGVSMLFRSAMLTQIGLFYEPLEMYLEDAELCTRAGNSGWRIVYDPNSRVLHKYMQSSSKQPSHFYQQKAYRNYLILVWRHYSWRKLGRAIKVCSQQLDVLGFVLCLGGFAKYLITHPNDKAFNRNASL